MSQNRTEEHGKSMFVLSAGPTVGKSTVLKYLRKLTRHPLKTHRSDVAAYDTDEMISSVVPVYFGKQLWKVTNSGELNEFRHAALDSLIGIVASAVIRKHPSSRDKSASILVTNLWSDYFRAHLSFLDKIDIEKGLRMALVSGRPLIQVLQDAKLPVIFFRDNPEHIHELSKLRTGPSDPNRIPPEMAAMWIKGFKRFAPRAAEELVLFKEIYSSLGRSEYFFDLMRSLGVRYQPARICMYFGTVLYDEIVERTPQFATLDHFVSFKRLIGWDNEAEKGIAGRGFVRDHCIYGNALSFSGFYTRLRELMTSAGHTEAFIEDFWLRLLMTQICNGLDVTYAAPVLEGQDNFTDLKQQRDVQRNYALMSDVWYDDFMLFRGQSTEFTADYPIVGKVLDSIYKENGMKSIPDEVRKEITAVEHRAVVRGSILVESVYDFLHSRVSAGRTWTATKLNEPDIVGGLIMLMRSILQRT